MRQKIKDNDLWNLSYLIKQNERRNNLSKITNKNKLGCLVVFLGKYNL